MNSTMASSTEGSPSVKSQLSYGEDLGDNYYGAHDREERSPVLDASLIVSSGLGSQQMRKSMVHPLDLQAGVSSTVYTDVNSIAAAKSTQQGILHALENKRKPSHTLSAFQATAAYGDEQIVIHTPVGPILDTQDDDLTQIQLVAPTINTEPSGSSDQALGEPIPKSQVYTKPVVQKTNLAVEYGIEIDTNGNIAVQMCRIPDEQRELLDSNSKWYPPLVGSVVQEGTVPLALLNVLTAAADTTVIQSATNLDDLTECSNDHKDQLANVDMDVSEDTSSEVDSEDWPDSSPPAANPDQLPPNSSPLLDEYVLARPQVHHSDEGNFGRVPDSVSATRMRVKQSPQMITSHGGEQQHEIHHLDMLGHIVSVDESSHDPAAQGHQNPGSSNLEIEAAVSHYPQSIQVNRTPYATKRESLPGAFLVSTDVVPGTFDDSNRLASTRHQDRNQSQKAANTIQSDDFELDSSEHGASHHQENTHSTYSGKPQNFRSRLASTLPHPVSKEQLQHASHVATAKRQASEANISDPQQRKRSRGSRERSSPFAELDETRRSYRREFFQDLTRKRYTASQRNSPTSASSGTHPMESTLPTNQSQKQARRSQYTDIYEDGFDLFKSFTQAYPTYPGERDHFYAACQLLRETLSKSHIHPSLWDAFVFHHHGDYRFYLQKVSKDSGTALSYLYFFDTIDNPGCNMRVITRGALRGDPPEQFSTPTSSTHDADMDHDIPGARSNISDQSSKHLASRSSHQRLQEPRLSTAGGNTKANFKQGEKKRHNSPGIAEPARDASVSNSAENVESLPRSTPDKQLDSSGILESVEVIAFRPSPRKPMAQESRQLTPEQAPRKPKIASIGSLPASTGGGLATTKSETKSVSRIHTLSKPVAIKGDSQQTQKPHKHTVMQQPDLATIDTIFTQFVRDYNNLAREQTISGSKVGDGNKSRPTNEDENLKKTNSPDIFVDIFNWTRR